MKFGASGLVEIGSVSCGGQRWMVGIVVRTGLASPSSQNRPAHSHHSPRTGIPRRGLPRAPHGTAIRAVRSAATTNLMPRSSSVVDRTCDLLAIGREPPGIGASGAAGPLLEQAQVVKA
jgi:hypothetical protein